MSLIRINSLVILALVLTACATEPRYNRYQAAACDQDRAAQSA
jgi:uncharacterized lipoprotein YmbA